MPSGADRHYTIGFDAVRNPSGQSITVREARLVGARNLQLEAAYLLPLQEGQTLVGNHPGWPPAALSASAEAESHRLPVELPPAAGINNLLLHVVADADGESSFDFVELGYTSGLRSFRERNITSGRIMAACF